MEDTWRVHLCSRRPDNPGLEAWDLIVTRPRDKSKDGNSWKVMHEMPAHIHEWEIDLKIVEHVSLDKWETARKELEKKIKDSLVVGYHELFANGA